MTQEINKHHKATDQAFAAISLLTVAAGVVAAFWLLGSPGKQRLIALDRTRLTNLRDIAYELEAQVTGFNSGAENPLPETLPSTVSGVEIGRDPLTDAPYEYIRLSDTTYQLCATFATASENDPLIQQKVAEWWQHPAGRHCFDFDATEPVPFLPYYR
ncbi:MAG: hypothetical protein AAFQ40_16700 [Cyanobacteria bacterium J06623_5]